MGMVSVTSRCGKCGFLVEEVEVEDGLAWDKAPRTARDGTVSEVWTAEFTFYCPNCANPIPVKAERVYAADGRLVSEDVEFLDE